MRVMRIMGGISRPMLIFFAGADPALGIFFSMDK
jgi:hypothetical protein